MPKPIEKHVKLVLAKNERDKKLLEAINHGWVSRNLHPDSDLWRRKSTRAHVVWEATVKKAIELFAGDRGVTIIPHFDTVSFIFDDAVFVRFKKADVALRSSNIQTALSGLFHEHDADLFGHEGLQRVEACYVLNMWETEVVWAGIVAREKKAHLWHFSLDMESAPAQAKVLAFQSKPKIIPADLAKVKKDKTVEADEDNPKKKDEE